MQQFPRLPHTRVIAFGHRARHGKDSAAALIAHEYPDALRIGFADALKAFCRVQWGMTGKDAPLLQRVGVAFRMIDPDIWLKALYWTIAERAPALALITDMRFPNEFQLVKDMGGLTIKVERRDSSGRLFVPTDRDPNHESEIALAGETRWDAVIENPEGHLDTFEQRVLRIVGALVTGGDVVNRIEPRRAIDGETQKAA